MALAARVKDVDRAIEVRGHLVAELPAGQLLRPSVAVEHPAGRVEDGDRHWRVANHLLEAEPRDLLGDQRGHQPHRNTMRRRNRRMQEVSLRIELMLPR
jgi:hypothetical protein